MRTFFLLLGFSQCARADLECNGRYLMDPDKCRLAEVNRVFDLEASTASACTAVAIKINAHPQYNGPTITC
eukprot:gene14058-14730_t